MPTDLLTQHGLEGEGAQPSCQVLARYTETRSLGKDPEKCNFKILHIQCSVRREGTGHYFSFQPFSRPLSMLSTRNTYQNDPQGIPINVIIMISHHVTVR